MSEKRRKSGGRFGDHVLKLAKIIMERHGFSLRRSRKLIGIALADPRIISVMVEHVNRIVTGRGDGLTLIDVGETGELRRLEQRSGKNKKAVSVRKKTRRKSA